MSDLLDRFKGWFQGPGDAEETSFWVSDERCVAQRVRCLRSCPANRILDSALSKGLVSCVAHTAARCATTARNRSRSSCAVITAASAGVSSATSTLPLPLQLRSHSGLLSWQRAEQATRARSPHQLLAHTAARRNPRRILDNVFRPERARIACGLNARAAQSDAPMHRPHAELAPPTPLRWANQTRASGCCR